MANRKPIPQDIQTKVLTRCRRRCCICYGLDRDTSLKRGQIAHLDHNPSNNKDDNLAYLCLEHHDEYDGRTSQSKGLTAPEVKHFREELVEALSKAFREPQQFGRAQTTPKDPIAGHYVRVAGGESADLKVARIPDGYDNFVPRYHVSGLALWGTRQERGPNIGTLDFISELTEGKLLFHGRGEGEDRHEAELSFSDGYLDVTERNTGGAYGMNVTFSGQYERADDDRP